MLFTVKAVVPSTQLIKLLELVLECNTDRTEKEAYDALAAYDITLHVEQENGAVSLFSVNNYLVTSDNITTTNVGIIRDE